MCEVRTGETVHPAGYSIKVKVQGETQRLSDGGIILKSDLTSQQLMRGAERGEVLEIGPLAGTVPGESAESWGLKIGNTIYFDRYNGFYFEDEEGNGYIFIKENQIIAYIDKEDKIDE